MRAYVLFAWCAFALAFFLVHTSHAHSDILTEGASQPVLEKTIPVTSNQKHPYQETNTNDNKERHYDSYHKQDGQQNHEHNEHEESKGEVPHDHESMCYPEMEPVWEVEIEITEDLDFIPAQVSVYAGGNVTWHWEGSATVCHNVAADDLSFRCARGCHSHIHDADPEARDADKLRDSVSVLNPFGHPSLGDPTNQPFSFTRSFETPGVIGYHSEVHDGMTGKILVVKSESVPDVPPPKPAYTHPHHREGFREVNFFFGGIVRVEPELKD